jgi:hypothetical protein
VRNYARPSPVSRRLGRPSCRRASGSGGQPGSRSSSHRAAGFTTPTCSASLTGPTRDRAWSQTAAREQLRHTAALAGVRRRFAPHQLRNAHAVEMAREGVPLIVIQRRLGYTNLGISSIYLQGIDSAAIIDTVHARRRPSCRSTARCGPDRAPAAGCRLSRRPRVGTGTTRRITGDNRYTHAGTRRSRKIVLAVTCTAMDNCTLRLRHTTKTHGSKPMTRARFCHGDQKW